MQNIRIINDWNEFLKKKKEIVKTKVTDKTKTKLIRSLYKSWLLHSKLRFKSAAKIRGCDKTMESQFII